MNINTHLHAQRSTEAPMDFQFTSRPSSNTKPVWASDDGINPPKKRPFDHLQPTSPAFPHPPQTPMFGGNRNVPFIFQAPVPQAPPVHAWAPPVNFSSQKAFPPLAPQEPRNVDTSEPDPPNTEASERESGRIVATGALRRIFNLRQRARTKSHQAVPLRNDAVYGRKEGSDTGAAHVGPVTHNTTNNYIVNMGSAPAPQPDRPQVLLGYLQVFFYLSLVVLFLYFLVQFIITVQHDVEHRVSEYSMDIVQDIAMCATHYRSNICESNTLPAMIQQCASWKTCMNRDTATVGRARVGAELIAEVANSLVEPISWKTLAFTLTSLSLLTLVVKSLFSLNRSRHEAAHSPPTYPVLPIAQLAHHSLPSGPTPGGSGLGNGDDITEDAPRRRRLEGGRAVRVN
ncbi:Di-sulfide bridge nucleocytoplasmic transport domain-containing protein [Suillus paluster]|uniref:Di-sulfide bridge nucleocytoplasmic transport domain-containing protein n=1 Tax=Suillus paluster TaxID=48578 RepID=UPI001B8741B6|nr:Di-sulfide bridge nucleocytoplasmic transport domain-containing protein [Suillus paluster]KAG1753618.1 Di-sulfide bridge nucleocytoplasmic transport domain-containing protein [Suillus paluster]